LARRNLNNLVAGVSPGHWLLLNLIRQWGEAWSAHFQRYEPSEWLNIRIFENDARFRNEVSPLATSENRRLTAQFIAERELHAEMRGYGFTACQEINDGGVNGWEFFFHRINDAQGTRVSDEEIINRYTEAAEDHDDGRFDERFPDNAAALEAEQLAIDREAARQADLANARELLHGASEQGDATIAAVRSATSAMDRLARAMQRGGRSVEQLTQQAVEAMNGEETVEIAEDGRVTPLVHVLVNGIVLVPEQIVAPSPLTPENVETVGYVQLAFQPVPGSEVQIICGSNDYLCVAEDGGVVPLRRPAPEQRRDIRDTMETYTVRVTFDAIRQEMERQGHHVTAQQAVALLAWEVVREHGIATPQRHWTIEECHQELDINSDSWVVIFHRVHAGQVETFSGDFGGLSDERRVISKFVLSPIGNDIVKRMVVDFSKLTGTALDVADAIQLGIEAWIGGPVKILSIQMELQSHLVKWRPDWKRARNVGSATIRKLPPKKTGLRRERHDMLCNEVKDEDI
jgi:hypothetical protein